MSGFDQTPLQLVGTFTGLRLATFRVHCTAFTVNAGCMSIFGIIAISKTGKPFGVTHFSTVTKFSVVTDSLRQAVQLLASKFLSIAWSKSTPGRSCQISPPSVNSVSWRPVALRDTALVLLFSPLTPFLSLSRSHLAASFIWPRRRG